MPTSISSFPSLPFATFATLATLAITLVLGGCGRAASHSASTGTDPVARGRALVSIGGCNDCHTPMKFDPEIGMPVPDMTRMLSGHPQGAPDPVGAPDGHD